MIEKETDGTDRTTIASVIYNRLNNPARGRRVIYRLMPPFSMCCPKGKLLARKIIKQ